MTSVKLFVRIDEAAELLSVGRRTIYRLVNEGRLRMVKVGRASLIARDELQRFAATLSNDKAA